MIYEITNSDRRKGFEYEPPSAPIFTCPSCGAELAWDDRIYTSSSTDHIIGCSRCTDKHDAWDWFADVGGEVV